MLLASVTDILEQLGFEQMTDITVQATQALDGAEDHLAALLNTSFEAATYTDTFYVEEPPYRKGQAWKTEFRLTNGLLSQLISVKMNGNPTAFDETASTEDVTSNVSVHMGKGVVTDFKTFYKRQFVQITYSAGFAPSASDPTSYDLSQVPDWLQRAARLKALIGMADSASLAEAAIKLDTKLLGLQLNALVSRHLRYAPAAILPL